MTRVKFKPALVNVRTREVLPRVRCSVVDAILGCSAPVPAPAAAQLCLTLAAGPVLTAGFTHGGQEALSLSGRGQGGQGEVRPGPTLTPTVLTRVN